LIKKALREILIWSRLDFTVNLKVDRLTRAVMRKILKKDSNTIDVGCHKGEILQRALRLSPAGRHAGFEPIPDLFEALREKFSGRADIYPFALFDSEGEGEFYIVENAPGYSSLRRRELEFGACYRPVTVNLRKLDSFFDASRRIDFIKIDVEGSELQVLKGAAALLARDRPLLLFECGKGGYDYFNDSPLEIYQYLSLLGYNIYTMEAWAGGRGPLPTHLFLGQFARNDNYYFVAADQRLS
jgi:FkbM family methyltransferase